MTSHFYWHSSGRYVISAFPHSNKSIFREMTSCIRRKVIIDNRFCASLLKKSKSRHFHSFTQLSIKLVWLNLFSSIIFRLEWSHLYYSHRLNSSRKGILICKLHTGRVGFECLDPRVHWLRLLFIIIVKLYNHSYTYQWNDSDIDVIVHDIDFNIRASLVRVII